MAIWLAKKLNGKPNELQRFITECKSKGLDFRIVTDDPGNTGKLAEIVKRSGIKGVKTSLMRDESNTPSVHRAIY